MAFEHLKAKLSLDASEFKSGVQNAQRGLDDLSTRTQRAGKKMQRAGVMMTGAVTAPLTAMGAMAVRQSARFDEAMANSLSVMSDVSAAMEEDLRDTAREVATATEHSHAQVAESFYFLASAGLSSAETMAALPAVADFASAGQMQLAEATSVTTTVMRAYGYEASEMTDVTDSLAKAVSSHNTTMGQMSTAMSQVGPVAASLGVGLDETAAAIGTVSDAGVQGERAGTALRNILSQLSDETSTASSQLREMGVSTRDSEGNVRSLTAILRSMEKAGVDAGQASQIFGMEAGPAMAALMDQGSAALQEHTANVRNSEGASAEMAATQRDTLNKQLAMTRSNLNDVAVVMGSHVIPYVRVLSGSVSDAAQRFDNLSGRQQKLIIAGAGVLALLGPTIALLGTIALASTAASSGIATLAAAKAMLSGVIMGTLVPALTATSIAGLPVWALLGALAVAAGALYYAWKNDLLGMQGHAETAFGAIGDFIDWLISKLNKIPGVDIDIDEARQSMSNLVSDAKSKLPQVDKEIKNIGDGSDLQIDQEQFKQLGSNAGQTAGAAAGQEFGSEFNKQVVESLRPQDIADHLTEELKTAQQAQSDLYAPDDPARARELNDRIETLQERIDTVESADSLSELDQELVVRVAEAQAEDKRNQEAFIDAVVAAMEKQQSDSDSESTEEEVVRATVEEIQSQSGSGSGASSDGPSRREQLRQIVQELKALRDEILTDGSTLDLSGPLRIDGDVVTVDDLEARLRLEARRADNEIGG